VLPCRYILDVLFPRTCPACGRVLVDEEPLCDDCLRHFDRSEQALNRDNETEKYFVNEPHFVWGGCWLHYKKGSSLQRLIHKAKYGNGKPELLRYMGRCAAREWEETGFFDSVDVIVPVPLHKRRLRERGFNQSEYIARGLSDVLGIPMDTDHISRVRATKKQSQSTFEERQTGVAGAFEVNHPEEWYRKTIMLVDDIVTTGATMRAMMEALKEVYGLKIVVFALAKAK